MPVEEILHTPLRFVLRTTFRSLLAWLLLLCLLRTLLPEVWVVAWHPHQHTTAEPAFAAKRSLPSQLLFTSRHQHCHAEQFYNVPFAPAVCVAMPVLLARACYPTRRLADERAALLALAYRRASRGPPAA